MTAITDTTKLPLREKTDAPLNTSAHVTCQSKQSRQCHGHQLPSFSPFLKPKTLVPLKQAIVHMGSGQHGQVLGFTKCRHDLPNNLRLLHTGLGTLQEMKICIGNQTHDTKDGGSSFERG